MVMWHIIIYKAFIREQSPVSISIGCLSAQQTQWICKKDGLFIDVVVRPAPAGYEWNILNCQVFFETPLMPFRNWWIDYKQHQLQKWHAALLDKVRTERSEVRLCSLIPSFSANLTQLVDSFGLTWRLFIYTSWSDTLNPLL